ncbi:MAG TPA: anhydro-N-acetylmuramic acid kinase [Myxococcaceae bacterium]|jgi:anhydro-N-acetylmuramic acid kinase|nr:anhydro-N-acetylmuramic acid kinase [Myxococcaceae bacterium]
MSNRRLERTLRKRVRLCVGLMSGTSVDGVDAALCRIRGTGGLARLSLLGHSHTPFEPKLSERIRGARSAAEISELNFLLGERFARAALKVIASAGGRAEQVDAIGSHGQTIAHLPPPGSARPSTLQIGEASVIAERTGIPTISDFRTRDIAAGGQGAPLLPYADWVLFRIKGKWRALQNIGGIANVSVVGDRLSDTIAFDSGPGNLLLDALARRITSGRLGCDLDGKLSRRGTPIRPLLTRLLQHPFFRIHPPRSTGWEDFGEHFATSLWARYQRRPFDLIATALAFTVEATARAYERWILPRVQLEAIYVSGGGSRNPQLMRALQRRLSPIPVRLLSSLGFPEQAKEAACFALLASECLSGTPQNVPPATGARHPVVLGKISR